MTRADSPLLGQMVFVVGVRRSGTNWLQRLLCLHPEMVAVPSETHLFWHAIPALQDVVQHGLLSSPKTGTTYMPRDVFLDATRGFCDTLFGGLRDGLAPGASRIVERTPWHAQRLDVIAAVYPDAWVVHIVRDPRDVAASLVAQEWGPTTLDEAAAEWRDTVTAARNGHGPRYVEVRQEDLQRDPGRGVATLLEWVGLRVDETLRRRLDAEAIRPVNTVRAEQGQSRRDALTVSEVAVVEGVAGALMDDLGYVRGGGRPDAPAEPPARRRPSIRARVARVRSVLRADDTAKPGGSLWLESAQMLVDRFVSAVAADDVASWSELVDDDAIIVVNGVEERGPRGVRLLAQALPAHRGLRQRAGEAHGGYPSFTVVLVHEDPAGGSTLAETFVLAPSRDRLSRIVYYGHHVTGS